MMSQVARTGYYDGFYHRGVLHTTRAVKKYYLFATITCLVCFEIAEESTDKTSEVLGTLKTKLFDKIIIF
jgi:hypothetical protein